MSEENNIISNNTVETNEIKTEGTVNHNKTLLNELKQARAELAALHAEREDRETESAKKKGDYETLLKKEQEKSAKAIREREEALAAANAKATTLMTENTLKDMIASYDVKPSLRPALVAFLKSQMEIADDGVSFDGQEPAAFAKKFFGSDDGREFLKPLLNSGGGATGNTGTTPATPDKWNMTTYAEMKAEDPVAAAAYAKKHGKNF